MESQIIALIGLIVSLVGGIFIAIDAFGLTDFIEILEYQELQSSEEEELDEDRIYDDAYCEKQKLKAQRNITKIFYTAFINTTSTYLFFNLIISLIAYFVFKISLFYCLILFFIWYGLWKLLLYILGKFINLLKIPPIQYKNGDGFLKCFLTIVIFPLWLIYYGIPYLIHSFLKHGIDAIFYYIGENLIARKVIIFLKYARKKLTYASYSKFNPPVFKGLILILIGFIYQALGIVLSLIK